MSVSESLNFTWLSFSGLAIFYCYPEKKISKTSHPSAHPEKKN